MAKRIREESPQPRREARTDSSHPTSPAANNRVTQKGEEIKKDMDRLMDEIDDVLEENAEEFVKNYVQKGGE